MINVDALLARVDLAELVERHGVTLEKSGPTESVGLCPFHSERTPSFHVIPEKRFLYCFGCGWSGNAISFVMEKDGYDFVTACQKLGGTDMGHEARRAVQAAPHRDLRPAGEVWVAISPVPDEAPRWVPGVEGRVWNVKRGKWWDRLKPERADEYRGAGGELLGYVLRTTIKGDKITPMVTWCIGPRGQAQWCLQPFPELRPLCGLDDLAARPAAPVLVVEGEKCRYIGRDFLTPYVVITWPGGSHGIAHADWSPLAGRDVVLWPDADQAGLHAMLGYEHRNGALHEGIAQQAYRAGCASLRIVDTSGQPKGWDIADAVADGWTAKQLAAWARTRVRPIDVEPTSQAVAS